MVLQVLAEYLYEATFHLLSQDCVVAKISASGFRQIGTVHSEVKCFNSNTALKHMIAPFTGFQELSVKAVCKALRYHRHQTSYARPVFVIFRRFLVGLHDW